MLLLGSSVLLAAGVAKPGAGAAEEILPRIMSAAEEQLMLRTRKRLLQSCLDDLPSSIRETIRFQSESKLRKAEAGSVALAHDKHVHPAATQHVRHSGRGGA